MKLNEALELGEMGRWQEAQVRISPGDHTQWFVMLRDTQHKFFVLVDNDDEAIESQDINTLAELIRSIGLKEFTVFF